MIYFGFLLGKRMLILTSRLHSWSQFQDWSRLHYWYRFHFGKEPDPEPESPNCENHTPIILRSRFRAGIVNSSTRDVIYMTIFLCHAVINRTNKQDD